jgi:hypothetical protein
VAARDRRQSATATLAVREAGIRSELIFERGTSALLEERDVALEGNHFGYAPGTVTGFATYVSSGVVERLGATP